jgi:hypothetical protein
MSACARCRWGPGTTTERPPNTETAKQLEGGLAAIMAARAAQDCTYFPQEPQHQVPQGKTYLESGWPTQRPQQQQQQQQQPSQHKGINSLRFDN